MDGGDERGREPERAREDLGLEAADMDAIAEAARSTTGTASVALKPRRSTWVARAALATAPALATAALHRRSGGGSFTRSRTRSLSRLFLSSSPGRVSLAISWNSSRRARSVLDRRSSMRWPFGSGKQIAWSFAVIALRMVVMGVALFGSFARS